MMFADKSLQCLACVTTSIFSVQEQEFHQSKVYTNKPNRFPECRQTRKSANGNSIYRTPHLTFAATCDGCGKSTEVTTAAIAVAIVEEAVTVAGEAVDPVGAINKDTNRFNEANSQYVTCQRFY